MPFWTDPEDVSVDIQECDVSVRVRGSLDMRRTYWHNACAHCDDVHNALVSANQRSRDGLALPGDAESLHAEESGVMQSHTFSSVWFICVLCLTALQHMNGAKASRP